MNIFKFLFRKKRSKNKSKKFNIKMDNINEAIFNHLKMKTSGALLLTGDWGSGKTYYIKNNILPKVEDETEFIPIIVSLFGETDKNNIAQKVLFAYFDKKGEKVNLSTGAIAKNLKNISEAIPIVKNYVDINKLIIGTGDNVFKFLPHDKLLICFDDIERMSDKFDVNDFLGIINELVENKGSKVLLIANEEKIKNGISFKEKTIDKTIHYLPDISLIYDDIIEAYSGSKFYEYLKNKKEDILNAIRIDIGKEEYKYELQNSFSNIRTLKFALEHFNYIYNIVLDQENIEEDLIEKQLHNLWIFILAISVEFKKPNNITFVQKRNLDKQSDSISKIILRDLGITNENEDEKEDEWTYSNKFKEKYYERLSETFIFYNDIYDFITSGRNIQIVTFIDQLNTSFNLHEGKINPAHALLNQFMHTGYWTFNDNEFEERLVELLGFVEDGKFDNIISYLNSGVYLIGFIDFVENSKDEVILKIKSGLDKYFNSAKLSPRIKAELDVVSYSFKEQGLQEILSYVNQKVEEIEKNEEENENKRLQDLFSKMDDSFISEFLPDNSGLKSPDKPIFNHFDQEIVKNTITKMDPSFIMRLSSMFKIRYIDTGFQAYVKDEIVFLKSLKEGITELPDTKKLSNHLLKTQLLSRIDECIKKLE